MPDRPADVVDLLTRAARAVPHHAVTPNGLMVVDALDYLGINEWEIALEILAHLQRGWHPTPHWWDLLIEAADLMWLADQAAWCRWARWESRHGTIRATLTVIGHRAPLPARGILRPLWDIGRPDQRIARLWIENLATLATGETATVRLAPLNPPDWHHVRPGQPITMFEGRPAVAVGTVIEVLSNHQHVTE
ncbi:hypothetical protein AB0J83_28625 [Actinoplanes sp. NPDC049596]|uniref:hypothetical protein n=1 Tax=unclassified Actinoplanes TaxID=2626549 RepID=UPI00343B06FB